MHRYIGMKFFKIDFVNIDILINIKSFIKKYIIIKSN